MQKFGVCYCNLDIYEPTVENLVEFETYDKALAYYLESIVGLDNKSLLPKNLWLVWLQDGVIVQLEQLEWNIKCKRIVVNE